jgi:hypothetical protein
MKSKNQSLLRFLGVVVLITGVLSVAADVLSAWSLDPRGMNTAVSVDLNGVKYSFLDKPRWSYVLGNYFGTFIMPIFHLVGLYLIAIAIKPFGRSIARVLLFVGAYLTAVGSGMHGTLAFVGDIVQSGNQALMNGILDYWQPWAYSLVVLYSFMSLFLAAVVLSSRTLYSRWMFVVSPLGVMILSTLVIAVLPTSLAGVKSFLAVTGLNLPMLIFYVTTIGVLFKQEKIDLGI